MTSRINVKLPDELSQRLNAVAEELGLNRSQVVRMALEKYVRAEAEQENKPYERVKHLIGSVNIDVPDLGRNHREHILRKLREKHMQEGMDCSLKLKKDRAK